MSHTATHLTTAAVLDHARGLLEDEAAHVAEAHAAVCDRCAAKASEFRALFDLARDEQLSDAPDTVIQRAIRLFPGRQSGARSTPRAWFSGLLRFDSLRAPVAFGVRSGHSSPRWMLFEAGAYTIGLRILARGSSRAVVGQVLGACAAGNVWLDDGAVRATAELNAFSEFELGPVPAGTYQLKLRLAGADIRIPELVLS